MAFLNLFGRVEIPLTRRAWGRKDRSPARSRLRHGRMTQQLSSTVREVVAMDFSFESLRVNRRKLLAAGIPNVHLVSGRPVPLPFADASFDRIVSCQVLEHVPGPEARAAAVAGLGRVLRPGGMLALSAYKHSLLTRTFGEKEGMHDGGIPFFRFTRAELRETLGDSRRPQRHRVLVYLYLARCTRR